MTSRERLLAVINGQIPDKVPVSPFIQEEFLSWYFKKQENDRVIDVVNMSKELHFDVITKEHLSKPYFLKKNYPNWEVEEKYETVGGNYYRKTKIVTPEKTFHQVEGVPYSEEYLSGIHFITKEFMINGQEDFEIFQKYCPKFPDEERKFIQEKARNAKKIIGDLGISAPWCYGGVFNLVTTFINIEDMLVDALADEDYYNEYMGFFTDILRTNIECHVDSDYDVVGVQGNMANGSIMGTSHFSEFVLPFENKAYEPAIEAKVPMLYHNCGTAKHLYDAYKNLNIQILETISEPPNGDVTLQYAKDYFKDSDLVLCGTLDQVNFLKTCTPEEARKEAYEKVEIGKQGGKYIFACSDYIEYGTPIENVKAMLDGAREASIY